MYAGEVEWMYMRTFYYIQFEEPGINDTFMEA